LLYNAEKKTFAQIPFPVHETIEFYQNAEGLTTE
jgi:cation-transporting ATPase 13A1